MSKISAVNAMVLKALIIFKLDLKRLFRIKLFLMGLESSLSYTHHVIRHSSLEPLELERLVQFSTLLFTEETGEATNSPYSCAKEWTHRLELRKGSIHYLKNSQEEILGFAFTHHKAIPNILGEKIQEGSSSVEVNGSSIHIWLSGVKAQYRRYGLMSVLERHIMEEMRKGSLLTVNTYPDTFPGMAKWVSRQGYHYFDSAGKRHCWKCI
ncbi:hypothetical protein K7432_004384 [Basidiobolus ranarum]|uniref:N-acetyltransferase domain-containing protein n=1 Tax=Basidiobolus ranarum TaxID=34480 RepID=A0ABR2WY83_9FUNG